MEKLHKKKYREELNQYIIEGFHLVEEAVKANADVQWILFNQRGQQEWGTWLAEQETEKLIFVSDEVLNSLSDANFTRNFGNCHLGNATRAVAFF